jgi:DNA-directed RNA polymerase subunit K/omega
MDEVNQPIEIGPEEAPEHRPEPARPITSRFLYVDIAALRAKQLRRGARPRISTSESAPVPQKAERVAMEEVRQGLVYYDVPDQKALQATEGS